MTALAVEPIFDPGCPVPCGESPDLFVGPSSEGRLTYYERAAIRICSTCPVQQKCLDFAMRYRLNADDVMGGTTGWMRRTRVSREELLSRESRPQRGCRNGHSPDRHYRRPNGDLRCADCDREAWLRRKTRKAAA